MKFETPIGVGVARCDQKMAKSCYLQACRRIGENEMRVHSISERVSKEESSVCPKSVVKLAKVMIDSAQPD